MKNIANLTNENLNAGLVCAANERIANAVFSQALTTYAAGVRDTGFEELLKFIAPDVRVPSRRFEYKVSGKGGHFSESDDIRDVDGDFKLLATTGEIVNAKTQNKGLVIRIDNDERYDGIEEEKTQLLLRRLIRNDAMRAISMLAVVAGTPTAKAWLTGSTKTQPDADLRDLIASVGDAVMLDANRLIFGRSAWSVRLGTYEASTAPYAGVAANMGAVQLADKLGIEKIYKSGERVITGSGKAAALTAGYIYAFIGQDSPDREDASSIKRFVSPCTDGGNVRVYREEKAKYVDITVEHYSLIANTVAGSVKGISVS